MKFQILAASFLLMACGDGRMVLNSGEIETENGGVKRMQFPGHVDDSYTNDEGIVFNIYMDFTEESDSELVKNYHDYGRVASIVYETHKELGRPRNDAVLQTMRHWYILVVRSENQFYTQYAWPGVGALTATLVTWRPKSIPGRFTMVAQDENFNKPVTIVHEMLHAVAVVESSDITHENAAIWDESDPNSLISLVLEKFGTEKIQ